MSTKTIATLKLFNCIEKGHTGYIVTSGLVRKALEAGLYLDPAILTTSNLNDAISVYGLTERQANQTLHKSWDKVRDASVIELVIDQFIHYISTYGFEALGIFQNDWVYIPDEDYEYSGTDWKIRYIRVATPAEIKEKVLTLVSSGIALKEETVNHLFTIIQDNVALYSDIIDHVANRELMTKLCDTFGFIPSDPEKWLRYVVYKLTGETLLIKNRKLIAAIKANKTGNVDAYIRLKRVSNIALAGIFNRYKEIFLAMKSISSDKTFFNHLSKLSKTYHKPLPEDYLNSITSHVQEINLVELESRLTRASIWRKIRLAYALQYRLAKPTTNVYLVRNGKSYVETDFNVNPKDVEAYARVLGIVLESIADTLSKTVGGKTVFIPDYIDYALPATEKQFFGNIPAGTSVGIYKNTGVGVHWFNTPDHRVDLDFAAISAAGKFGWDGGWRDSNGLLFSGDMTNAPRPDGASEMFQISTRHPGNFLFSLNYYNSLNYFDSDNSSFSKIEVDMFVADEVTATNRVVSAENVLVREKFVLPGQQCIVGALVDNRFYFIAPFVQGKGRSIRVGAYVNATREWLITRASNPVHLEMLLRLAGAHIVRHRPDQDVEYIDLTPESLTKDTIIGLLTGNI